MPSMLLKVYGKSSGQAYHSLSSAIAGIACLLTISISVSAQIVPDRALPTPSTVMVAGETVTITGGTTMGTTLLHSFSEFSVPSGGTAIFQRDSSVQTILTRVTGSKISRIDGLIRTTGTTNVMFQNHHGVVLGSNARLELGGSFLAMTANRLKVVAGNELSTTNAQTPPLTIQLEAGVMLLRNAGPSSQIVQTCASQAAANRFIVTGRGGLPPDPVELLNAVPVWVDDRSSQTPEAIIPDSPLATASTSTLEPQSLALVEASNWVKNSDGTVSLVADSPLAPLHTASDCRAIVLNGRL